MSAPTRPAVTRPGTRATPQAVPVLSYSRAGHRGGRDEDDVNLRTTLPVATLALLLTTACTAGGVEPPGLTAAPTTSTPTPTPSPTPDPDGILVQSDPELGIVFDDVPALTGVEADVYDTVALYKKAYWTTMTTNEVNPLFDTIASPELKAGMGRVVAKNVAINADIAGTYRVRISQVAITGEGEASVAACSDYSEATFASDDGTFTPEEAGFGIPQRSEYKLRNIGDTWQITTGEVIGSC